MNMYLRKPFKTMEVNLIWKKETIFLYITSPELKKEQVDLCFIFKCFKLCVTAFQKACLYRQKTHSSCICDLTAFLA